MAERQTAVRGSKSGELHSDLYTTCSTKLDKTLYHFVIFF